MRFQDTKFWQNYSQYDRVVFNSSMRSTIDAVIYWRLLSNFKFNNILEIGVYQGLTSGLFFEANPESCVTAIDPKNRLELFYKNYPEYQSQFKFINASSQTVDLTPSMYDFILIDGDHCYQQVKDDIIKFLPRLTPTGVLAIDDYKLPEVANAIQYLYNSGTDWIPFLRAEQTEFWHHRSCDRSIFLDSLLTDAIGKFIFIENIQDQKNNTVCSARTLGVFTDMTEFFNLALKHYNI